MTDPRRSVARGPRQRAIYYAPVKAFSRGGPAVPIHVFVEERNRAFAADAPTGFVPLDLGATLQTDWPATTPALLARYLVLRAAETFSARLQACGEVYYVIVGAGSTHCAGERIDWRARDAFCLPGMHETTHQAGSDGALLFLVTNEPEVARLGKDAVPASTVFVPPTHFEWHRVCAELAAVHARTGPQLAAGKSVLFVTAPMAEIKIATPTILASINTLEAGAEQRPHRHSSAALTLSLQGEGVYSLVDGRRVDWVDGAVALTPPGAVHSHHNGGSAMMTSFVAQDTGLHTYLRTTDFRWTDP